MLNITGKKIILIIFVILFCASLLLNGWLTYQLSIAKKAFQKGQLNERILVFTDMFVKDVLLANKEIDFDTRLSLETAVRGLGDQEVFEQWSRFTKASTEEDASREVKLLLNLLISKIKP